MMDQDLANALSTIREQTFEMARYAVDDQGEDELLQLVEGLLMMARETELVYLVARLINQGDPDRCQQALTFLSRLVDQGEGRQDNDDQLALVVL